MGGGGVQLIQLTILVLWRLTYSVHTPHTTSTIFPICDPPSMRAWASDALASG